MTDTLLQSTALLPVIKHTSRFTEHFDLVPPATAFEPFALDASEYDVKSQRSMSISASRPFTFAKPVRMHSSPAITTSAAELSSSFPKVPSTRSPDPSYQISGGCPNDNSEIPLVAETSHFSQATAASNQQQAAPRKAPQPQQPQSVSLLYKDYASSSTSFNRADIMIKRLCNWLVFLKLVTGWIDEVVKITGSSAFKKQKKEHPELYDQVNKRRKKCQEIIASFKKECRSKLQALKINPALSMEELLLRAKETRKRMAHLTKLCEYADDPKRPSLPEMDPWLANLQVLRYLKRETTEENRLRELMIPIQHDMRELESRLIDSFADVVEFCAEQQTTVIQYGYTLDQVLGHFLPQYTWQAFVAAQQKDWVEENHIRKNYMQINYPNKQHTHVATAHKGILGRRSGVLKHYHDKYYVLTHYGYLHQFKLDDKVKPEDSIYLATSTTIQPEVNDDDILLFDEHGGLADARDNTDKHSNGSGHTFEIHYKRKKIYHFKTSTGKELVSWCRALTNVAKGTSVEKLLIQRKQKQAHNAVSTFAIATSSISGNSHQQSGESANIDSSIINWAQQQGHFRKNTEYNSTNYENNLDQDDDDDDDNMSQFHSCHFNEDDDEDDEDRDSGGLSRTGLENSDIISLSDVVDNGSTNTPLMLKSIAPHQLSSSASVGSNSLNTNLCNRTAVSSTISLTNYPEHQHYTSSPPSHSGSSSSSISLAGSSAVMTADVAATATATIISSPSNTPDLSSSSSSSTMPPPRRGIPAYKANLNLMLPDATVDSCDYHS